MKNQPKKHEEHKNNYIYNVSLHNNKRETLMFPFYELQFIQRLLVSAASPEFPPRKTGPYHVLNHERTTLPQNVT